MFFLAAYLLATELNSSTSNTAEVLLFLRGHTAKPIRETTELIGSADDQSNSLSTGAARNDTQSRTSRDIRPQKSIFTWRDVVYDIHTKDEPRRLLDHVSGWVKPGTLTALMGVSGAGKTTLLDVLAQRTSVGVVTGDMLVNGKPLASSFQRRAGIQYCESEDFYSEMLTMRQAMFSNRMFTLRPQRSVRRYVLVQCYDSQNLYRRRRSTIMWKT